MSILLNNAVGSTVHHSYWLRKPMDPIWGIEALLKIKMMLDVEALLCSMPVSIKKTTTKKWDWEPGRYQSNYLGHIGVHQHHIRDPKATIYVVLEYDYIYSKFLLLNGCKKCLNVISIYIPFQYSISNRI